jgi:Fe-S cluster biogenesis protein NfuA
MRPSHTPLRRSRYPPCGPTVVGPHDPWPSILPGRHPLSPKWPVSAYHATTSSRCTTGPYLGGPLTIGLCKTSLMRAVGGACTSSVQRIRQYRGRALRARAALGGACRRCASGLLSAHHFVVPDLDHNRYMVVTVAVRTLPWRVAKKASSTTAVSDLRTSEMLSSARALYLSGR